MNATGRCIRGGLNFGVLLNTVRTEANGAEGCFGRTTDGSGFRVALAPSTVGFLLTFLTNRARFLSKPAELETGIGGAG